MTDKILRINLKLRTEIMIIILKIVLVGVKLPVQNSIADDASPSAFLGNFNTIILGYLNSKVV